MLCKSPSTHEMISCLHGLGDTQALIALHPFLVDMAGDGEPAVSDLQATHSYVGDANAWYDNRCNFGMVYLPGGRTVFMVSRKNICMRYHYSSTRIKNLKCSSIFCPVHMVCSMSRGTKSKRLRRTESANPCATILR